MKTGKYLLFLLAFSLSFLTGFTGAAKDTTCVHQLLLYLQRNQSNGTTGFPAGLFPAYRQYVFHPGILKNDPNFFFTGLVLYTLNEIYPELSATDQAIVRSIRTKAIPALQLFKNKNGGFTYNFWRTNPPEIFPHSGWLNWFNRRQSLPDDFDDTSIGLMALQADTATARSVHHYMQQFVNGRKRRIKNALKKYRKLPAYSVWFGQNFPLDFDVCVLANTLSFVSSYHLPWTKADSASLKVIETAIKSGDYIHHPAFVAPHYHTTPIILYHLSRLTSVNPALLLNYRQELIQEAKKCFETAKNPVEKIMLQTTLLRWGVVMPHAGNAIPDSPETCSAIQKNISQSGFVFFIANMTSMLPNPLKAIGAQTGIGKFNYYCPAYNIALLLELKMTK